MGVCETSISFAILSLVNILKVVLLQMQFIDNTFCKTSPPEAIQTL